MRSVGRVLVGVGAVVMVLPFLYMVSTSLMDQVEVFRWPPPLLPASPQWGNYRAALGAMPFARLLRNTGLVAACVVVGQVATSAAAAYAFARLRFPGRDRIFVVFLSALLLPAVVLLIPRFLIVSAFGWVDTYAGLISTELVSVWGIFLLRQFFLSVPRDLEDAARLDGAGEWEIFSRVVLPLAQPALVTLAALAFVDQWKSFLWPLIVTRSADMQVVEVGIATFRGLHAANWPYQMAVAVTATIPVLVVFLVAQRYVLRGLSGTLGSTRRP